MVTKKTPKPAARPRPASARTKGPRNIWLELRAIGRSLSHVERSALPRDGARNLEHYLDGSPRAG